MLFLFGLGVGLGAEAICNSVGFGKISKTAGLLLISAGLLSGTAGFFVKVAGF
ncbi:hypothetical protein [Rossellomorea sp. NRS-1567]|uniref:hypothetical protein n=1 Tax=Rossellomorea sp. NRS-1567 TaxID=3233901 RepID=UPI003D29BD16